MDMFPLLPPKQQFLFTKKQHRKPLDNYQASVSFYSPRATRRGGPRLLKMFPQYFKMETSMNKEAFKLGQRRIGNRYGFLSDVTDDFFFLRQIEVTKHGDVTHKRQRPMR